METKTRRAISRQYFNINRLAEHHFRSFNTLLDSGLQTIIDQKGTIETSLGGEEEEPIFLDLGRVRVETPQIQDSDGNEKEIYPQESRLRNLSYAAPVSLEMKILIGGNQREEHVLSEGEVQIGDLPIMVQSKKCNLHSLSRDEINEKGEDPVDPGGYFILNGSERVLITAEDLVSNRIMTELDYRYGDQIEIAKTYSQYRGDRSLISVQRGRDQLLEVSFPSISDTLPFPTIVRALGLETDDAIVEHVSTDPEIVKFMLEILEEADIQSKQAALCKIGEKLAPKRESNYQLDRAQQVIERHLLPHFNHESTGRERRRIHKAAFLCRMAKSCFELALGRKNPNDKDHYANKRLRTSGDLMKSLFRAAFNRLGRDIEYQLKRTIGRSRSVSISTIVQPEIVTNRLERSLATGNWVGGRSGVSQLADRTDHLGIISHLRRLQSPLSRSQTHFGARDLHATQWGRICPSETPEGPNCGLEKNFAQGLELSKAVNNIEELNKKLVSFGVEGAGPKHK